MHFFNIGPYWINAAQITHCEDKPDIPQPALHVYLVGPADPTTCLTLKGDRRQEMLTWLKAFADRSPLQPPPAP